MADCRRCIYFKPYRDMSLKEIEQCESLARARGEECLGWCKHYNRGVTHYLGSCPAFRNKRLAPPKVTLADWIPSLRDY